MKTTFQLGTSEFKKMMKDVKRISKHSLEMNTKLSVQPNLVEFTFMGISRIIPAITEGYCDATVPFKILIAVAQTTTHLQLNFTIKDGEINIGSSIISHPAIGIKTIFAIKELDIPVNPTKIQILNLRFKFDNNKLEELGLYSQLQKEEEQLNHALHEAAAILNPYGITFRQLELLVEQIIKEE